MSMLLTLQLVVVPYLLESVARLARTCIAICESSTSAAIIAATTTTPIAGVIVVVNGCGVLVPRAIRRPVRTCEGTRAAKAGDQPFDR